VGIVLQRGQVSIEFIISIIFVLLAFIFLLGIFYQNLLFDSAYEYRWRAQNTADEFASAINNVYLLDGNAALYKTIYWNEPLYSVSLGEKSVLVWWNENQFSTSPIVAKVVWSVTDINGPLVFRKQNGVVVVGYE
jgi:hypothetical protein